MYYAMYFQTFEYGNLPLELLDMNSLLPPELQQLAAQMNSMANDESSNSNDNNDNGSGDTSNVPPSEIDGMPFPFNLPPGLDDLSNGTDLSPEELMKAMGGKDCVVQ